MAIGLIKPESIGFAISCGGVPVYKLNKNVLEEYC